MALRAQFTYTNSGGTAIITGYSGAGGAVVIPTTINLLNVTAIGANAFASNSTITSVTIPNSVAAIHPFAFAYCGNLVSVTIPHTVADTYSANIGNDAFYGDYSLTTVSVSDNVGDIGSYAFSGCGALSSFTIGLSEVPTYILDDAFSEDGSLTSFAFPTNTASIGTNAFFDCTGLTNITIPEGATSVEEGAFDLCYNLASISVASGNTAFISVGGVLFDSGVTTLVQYPGGKSGAYTIPSTVTTIAPYAFDSCFNLTAVTIPGSVATVGDYAFNNCTKLASADLLTGVTTIGNYMFSDCGLMTSVTIPATVTAFGTGAFDADYFLGGITIPAAASRSGSFSALTAVTRTLPNCSGAQLRR